MGLLEALIENSSVDLSQFCVDWIGPAISDNGWSNCSRNSTAVVALHGIKRGVSPLGDDLVDAFDMAYSFYEKNKPPGVSILSRFHLTGLNKEKLFQRFGHLEEFEIMGKRFEGVSEKALVYEPLTFMNWWQERLLSKAKERGLKIHLHQDMVTALKVGSGLEVYCLGKSLQGQNVDKIVDCRGSGVNELASAQVKIKRAPGHYWLWQGREIKEDLGEDPWIYTLNGHNLIYDAKRASLILGGSTEIEGVCAKSFIGLNEQREAFLELFGEGSSIGKVLIPHKAQVFTGVRPKGQKRRPLLLKNENHIVINGFYKNGYSLCYLYGKRALDLLNL